MSIYICAIYLTDYEIHILKIDSNRWVGIQN
uniref:Uncharacterized protein n=1 Tax=Anguilla anguilla TaxID=7936 RepID=A0A0E9QP40_ANGAN